MSPIIKPVLIPLCYILRFNSASLANNKQIAFTFYKPSFQRNISKLHFFKKFCYLLHYCTIED